MGEKDNINMIPLAMIILCLSISLSGAASERPVKVVKSSVTGRHVLVHIELDGKATEMRCTLGVARCVVPQPGHYLMVELPTDESVYTDCPNVRFYSEGTQESSRHEVGDYCLLYDLH